MSDNGNLLRKDLPEVKRPFITDSTYEFFRSNVEVVLPGIGLFYVTIAQVWGLPFGDQVSQTVNALALLLGLIIKTNKNRANNVAAVEKVLEETDKYAGDLIVGTGDEAMGLATLALEKDVEELSARNEITLRVKHISMPE